MESGTSDATGSLSVVGSKLEAEDDITLKSANELLIASGEEQHYQKNEEKKSGSMELSEHNGVSAVRSEVEGGGKVALEAKNDITLKAATIKSGDETEITSTDGQVAMLVTKDSEYERVVKSSTGYFSWSTSDEGTNDETVQHTKITAGGGLTITTAEGVVVQYKETGNVQDDIAQLAQSPGLEWMAEIANRDDVDWQAVQEVHNQWKESDSGIGGPGMQLVSLAMAVALSFTPGGQGFATGVLKMAGDSAMTAAVAAGFNSLVIQAGMQIVGNGGDIGAALQALASIDTVRALATAMLTAGLSKGLTDYINGGDQVAAATEAASDASETVNEASFIADLAQSLQDNAIQAGVSTGVDTAINGGNLGENLLANLRSAAVSTLGEELAQEIGEAYHSGHIDVVTHKIAHAALGGAMDLAMGGDGLSGAVGGVVCEITGEVLANEIEECLRTGDLTEEQALRWKNAGVDIAKLSAGLVAAAGGLDINAAADAAGNAAENNAMLMLISLIEHLTKDKYVLTEEDKAKDGAMLTLCVATYKDIDTGDYKEVPPGELEARGIKLVDTDSGLEGKVFYNQNTNELVVAFKGTDLTEINDSITNMEQGIGLVGKQYTLVSEMVGRIKNMANEYGATLVATGHSLGGGLASALASSGGVDRAVVFNPAGLHKNTATKFGGTLADAAAVTTSYVSREDVLNFAQQYELELGPIPLGLIMPDSVGEQRIINDAGFHSIDGFKKAFGLE